MAKENSLMVPPYSIMGSASKRQKCCEIGNEDRISKLPESIQGHILSFLFTNEAVKTSICARDGGSSGPHFPFYFFMIMPAETWIKAAITHNAEEIELSITRRGTRTPPLVRLPQLLFSCVSIRVLKLLVEDMSSFDIDVKNSSSIVKATLGFMEHYTDDVHKTTGPDVVQLLRQMCSVNSLSFSPRFSQLCRHKISCKALNKKSALSKYLKSSLERLEFIVFTGSILEMEMVEYLLTNANALRSIKISTRLPNRTKEES
ncbi:hypothetical protein RCOM_1209800 [Ricinus communis]|uniref:FBD domain-containing protein n=1 Tax=Ricinus communis TaxID=3988 RepID=B9S2M0_RICCO|nr:hypothetical protein RCOM_1209800 [Ricinus communis]